MIDVDTYKCPKCKSAIRSKLNQIICSNCKSEYPLLFGQIPILVSNKNELLSSYNKIISKYISESESRVSVLSDSKNGSTFNRTNDSKLIEAILSRINTYKLIKSELDKHTDTARTNANISYPINFSYPIRDLTENRFSSNELKVFHNILASIITTYMSSDQLRCCSLGSATSTFPLDLKINKDIRFDCLDLAPPFPMLMHLICKNLIDKLYMINLKNCSATKNLVIQYDAVKPEPFDQFNYVIANAENIPYQDDSFDIVLSNYFTDNVHIWKILPEIKRALKQDGLFIHYGPLFYHFKEYKFMYSEDEIKEIFSQNGFKVIYEDHIETSHCDNPFNNHKTVNNNWVFVAKYSHQ